MLSDQAVVAIIIFFLGVLGTMAGLIVKAASNWTSLASRLTSLQEAADRDRKEHSEKFETLTDELKKLREQTDQRLRWLEEREWRRGGGTLPTV